MSTQSTTPTWEEILPEPWTTLILGSRGSGKTALGHRLLELWGDSSHVEQPRDAYIMGLPEDVAAHLPGWIERLSPTTTMSEWPEDSIVLFHEAHHLLHARRSMDAENLEIDKLLTISRHKNSCVIVETQQSQRLDRNAVTAVDAVIVRQPALLQTEFERKGMREVISCAEEIFQQYVTDVSDPDSNWTFREQDPNVKKAAYVYSERFEGAYPHEIELADHYTDGISMAYSDAVRGFTSSETVSGENDNSLFSDEQTALDAVAEWEMENRPMSFDHVGAKHDDVPLQHAWNQLSVLSGKRLVKKTYNANNSPAQYRLTDAGWEASEYQEPSVPVVEPD